MTNYLSGKNLLLVLLLTGFLLVSDSLQCAFNCLTQAEHGATLTTTVRDCHLSIHQPDPVQTCVNKACHQRTPQHQDLGGPQLFSLLSLQHPLSGSSRLQLPLFRAAVPLRQAAATPQIFLATQSNDLSAPSQQLRSLRTTVLLN